jgi:hypothetical protein
VIEFLHNETKIMGEIVKLAFSLASCLQKLEPTDLNTDTELLRQAIDEQYGQMTEKKRQIEASIFLLH